MTKREFLDRAREKHGYKYQYPTLTDKILSTDDIDILYNGVLYKQKVTKHITLGRCPEKNTPTKTTEQFIKEAKEVWGDKYDYSLTDYKGALKTIKVIYDGIVFEQIASSHINGRAPELNMNKDWFIKRAHYKWGDKYDYSLVDYKDCKTKVNIIYNQTGEIFEQTPSNHLIYAPEKKIINKTTEQFIEQCSKIHNNKYSYDQTIYTKSSDKVIIKCPKHGYFKQNANSHFLGMGCKRCACELERNIKTKKNTEEFIIEAKEVWGDKYDYSLVDYKNAKTKVKIIYDDIIYEQLPISHLKYPVENYLNHEIFLIKCKRKWGDKYDYSLTKFKDCHTKIKILYNGVEYEQLPHNHLIYAPEKRNIKNKEEFINQSIAYHGDKYDYSLVDYQNDRIKVSIICKKHDIFKQTPSVHLRSGCPICSESKGEKSIRKYLESKKLYYKREYKFIDCINIKPLRFDFYIPSLRTCIEFDGIQHHQPIEHFGGVEAYERLKLNDKIKNDYCEENFIDLIRIRYDQIDRIYDILNESLRMKIKSV